MKKSVLLIIVVLAAFLMGAFVERETSISSRVAFFFENEGAVKIPATPEFVFKDHFSKYPEIWIKMDGGPWAPFFEGKDFKQFIEIIEGPKNASVLRYKTIKFGSSFSKTLKELGGEKRVVTTFAQIFHLIKNQKDGQDGPLLVSEFRVGERDNTNLFFVRSPKGTVYPVSVRGTKQNGKTRWSVYVEFYGEQQRVIDSYGIPFKYYESIPGDVVFYPN